MKTIDLDDVKETVMKRHGYKQKYWGSLSLDDQAVLLDSVAYEYAKQCCDEHRENDINTLMNNAGELVCNGELSEIEVRKALNNNPAI